MENKHKAWLVESFIVNIIFHFNLKAFLGLRIEDSLLWLYFGVWEVLIDMYLFTQEAYPFLTDSYPYFPQAV